MNRIEKYIVIKHEIDKWDPVYLYEMGCLENEYDLEITKISSGIEEFSNAETLAVYIYNIFLEMFGYDTKTKAENMVECKRVAQNIFNRINREK